jgi:hypothetical protein
MDELSARLASLEQAPDRHDMLTRDAVYSNFAKAVSEAATPEKRSALVNATAHQFDPTMGTPATRAYWMRRVSELSDIEIATVALFYQNVQLAFGDRTPTLFTIPRSNGNTASSSLPSTDVVAHEQGARSLVQRGLLEKQVGVVSGEAHRADATFFELTASGDAILRFIT